MKKIKKVGYITKHQDNVNKTKGIKQVYSTYDSWKGIEKIDSDIKAKLNEITTIKNNISQHFNDFKTITNKIGEQNRK